MKRCNVVEGVTFGGDFQSYDESGCTRCSLGSTTLDANEFNDWPVILTVK